jgi:hypothetical protein
LAVAGQRSLFRPENKKDVETTLNDQTPNADDDISILAAITSEFKILAPSI